MEYKIDSLVELAVVGRFHSTTSVCDSPICNTTNVHVAQPEVERKEEIGPDDVMDELEKERIIEDETGEELVEGKKAGNDENVSDEIEIVEKRMSTDFLTPEKLEEDANKSTKSVGDIVQIEDTGSELPKGRGHRTKRKTRLLCSPFTDPTKRRKLSDIDVYDPYREVDPSKIVIEALYHIRDRALKFPLLFQQDCSILDCYFCQFVELAHGDWQIHAQLPRKEEFKFSKSLLKYVVGSTPELVKIDLEDRTIFIFDSLKSHVRKAELEAFMKPLQVVIPLLMKLYVKCDDSYSTEQFRFIKMKEFPQQHNGFWN
ncbi:ubiquitin-like-specific protease 1A [Forsythia ovata]|uniref:Ubiquitin-like-specific protease 1A n=1 Tax=Forsythia ovata TaxID=205694 RepID=A0ABD1W7Z9_9LAMI